MYRPYCCLLIVLLLAGCASIEGFRFSESPFGRSESAEPSMKEEENRSEADAYEQEQQALLDQPYIDPLTNYLIDHQGDPARATILEQIQQERDRRCAAVARRYADLPPTEAMLERYDAGYAYSCPQQVRVFEERVNRQTVEPEPEAETISTVTAITREKRVSDQARSDCYLLTTIRNYSAARKACRQPAESGDVRSQANMATITYAFEEYTSAREWAEKAASGSGEAAFLLGQMYAHGRGVDQNNNQAVYWFREAARQGHEEAEEALDRQLNDATAVDP